MKNFKQYRYICVVKPEIPTSWEPHILKMLHTLDSTFRNKLIPKFVYNLRQDILLFFKLQPKYKNQITQIKQKFGTLKVQGTFDPKAKEIISQTESICNNTCEFCGQPNTSHVMVKNWVRNLCSSCRDTIKKNGVNIGNSSSN